MFFLTNEIGQGPGVVVKGACLESRRPFEPHSGIQFSKTQNPLTRNDSILWEASVTEI